MATVKLSNIGNSKGLILQKRLLKKYRLSESVEIIEQDGGILLRKPDSPREGWAEAFRRGMDEEEYEQLVPDFLDDDVIEEY